MPEIGTSGSMSGDGKRSAAAWPKLPRPSSTLPFLPFVALQHHGSYRGYRRHVADGAGRPSLTHLGHGPEGRHRAPLAFRRSAGLPAAPRFRTIQVRP
jgi:hypothetical protein